MILGFAVRVLSSTVVEIPLAGVRENFVVPAMATFGDAGSDLFAAEAAVLAAGGGRSVVGTGVAVAIPYGHAGLILPRSGLARRHGVTCLNTPGLIDAGYRGELQVLLINTDPTDDYEVQIGDRIAQLVIVAHVTPSFTVVDGLDDVSERGSDGWGHSGR